MTLWHKHISHQDIVTASAAQPQSPPIIDNNGLTRRTGGKQCDWLARNCEPWRGPVEDLSQAKEPLALFCPAHKRRLPSHAVPAIDRHRLARWEKSATKDRILVLQNLLCAFVGKPCQERIDGTRELKIPSCGAVDPGDLLEYAESRHRIDFKPAKCLGSPQTVEPVLAQRLRH